VSQSDDIASLVAFQVFLLARTGQAEQLRRAGFGADTGRLAKMVGATPAQIFAWERCDLEPTTGQALAWMRALQAAQPRWIRNPWAPAEGGAPVSVAALEPEPA